MGGEYTDPNFCYNKIFASYSSYRQNLVISNPKSVHELEDNDCDEELLEERKAKILFAWLTLGINATKSPSAEKSSGAKSQHAESMCKIDPKLQTKLRKDGTLLALLLKCLYGLQQAPQRWYSTIVAVSYNVGTRYLSII